MSVVKKITKVALTIISMISIGYFLYETITGPFSDPH